MHNRKKPKHQKQNIIFIAALIGIIGFSGYKLYEGFEDYWNAYLHNLKMSEEAGRDQKQINWKKLKKKNPDVIGWLYCPDTVIDYAVVQGRDNDTYLHTGADGKWSGAGALFIDCNNEKPFKDNNTIIYGHHMRDGSMFHDLDLWQSNAYVKKHPVVYLYTPNQNYRLDIAACMNVAATNETVYDVPYYDEEDVAKFLDVLAKAPMKSDVLDSMVPSDESLSMVTLSTCAYTFEDARTILVTKATPVLDTIQDIEKNKKEPDSKFTVFVRMIKEIVKEGVDDL